jgi:ABC-type taurine transport system ATPase subunit
LVRQNGRLPCVPREFVVIVGESGSAKTTLLRIITGLESPDRGSVAVNSRAVDGVGAEQVMVFQEPRLLPWLSVRKNVSYGLKLHNRRRGDVERKRFNLGSH